MMKKLVLATVVLCAVNAIFAADVNPLLYWKFDSSNPYADSSGNGNAIGTKGRPVEFSGGYAHFAHGTSGVFGRRIDLSSYKQLTIEFFVRVNSHYSATVCYFSFANNFKTDGCGSFSMYGGSNTTFAENITMAWLKSTAGSEIESTGPGVLADRKWHHVAVVMDVSDEDSSVKDEMKLYLDGVLQPDSTTKAHHSIGFRTAAAQFSLGYWSDTTWTQKYNGQAQPFEGDIDDFRITAAALTPDQFLKTPSVVETGCGESVVEWTDELVVPEAGSDVHVPTTACITLNADEPTPIFKSITVDGTMRFLSSNNCLRSQTVCVGAAGRLMGGEPFKGTGAAVVSNRVWISCTDLTVEKGGLISAWGCGFWGGKASDSTGYGPGAFRSNNDKRAGAGAHGGFMTTWQAADSYGSAEWPETAGSGGQQWAASGGISAPDAGGVIRIDATGTVVVEGRILADAVDCIPYESYGRACGSAGGSILVNCACIRGSGELSAKGSASSGNERTSGTNGGQSAPGAGGRIAVHYDPGVQTVAEARNLVFSVQAGRSYPNNYSFGETGFWMYAGAGTLWFPDAKLITAETVSNFRGRLVNAAEIVLDGETVISNWVGFATDGVKIKVNGNLTVTGQDGRLEIGGVNRATGDIQRKSYVSTLPSMLEVSGDLSVAGTSRFDIYAARTNGTQTSGAFVKVAGAMSIAEGCFVYPVSHPSNGGSVLFTVNDFALAEGGTFGLTGGGFSGGAGSKNGMGPGKGSAATGIGAGHGGRGGRSVEAASPTFGLVYGDAERPTLPGSGGGEAWNAQPGGGCGGGVLHVVASNSISIAGIVDATGTAPQSHKSGSSGGSGGSVLLESKTFTLVQSGKISAKGGDSGTVTMDAGKYTAGGAGGRIAIWTGAELWYPEMRKSRYAVSESVPVEWADCFSVDGGSARLQTAAYAGESGTIRFMTVKEKSGLILVVR